MKHTITCCMLVFSTSLIASNEEGTGRDSLRIIIEDSNRVVIENHLSDGIIIGSTQAEQGYGEMMLDQVHSDGQLSTSWGKAEVSLGCYQADVVIYQRIDQDWQEVAVMQLATDSCQQQ